VKVYSSRGHTALKLIQDKALQVHQQENQSRTGHLLKIGMQNFMKKVQGLPQSEIQLGYDEINSDIHQTRLSYKDTNHRDENTTDSGVSSINASASNLMGHLTMSHSMLLLQIFDNHQSTTGTTMFDKLSLEFRSVTDISGLPKNDCSKLMCWKLPENVLP
jgi:hypothetical protein